MSTKQTDQKSWRNISARKKGNKKKNKNISYQKKIRIKDVNNSSNIINKTVKKWKKIEFEKPKSNNIEIICIKTPKKISNLAIDEIDKILPVDEVARYNSIDDTRTRYNFLIGRIALRKILSYKTNQKEKDIEIKYGRKGKPYSRSHIYFNISHSGNIVGIGISESHPIGIDIENIKRKDTNYHDLKTVLPSHVADKMENLKKKTRTKKSIEYWNFYEACIKASGQGIDDIKYIDEDREKNYETIKLKIGRKYYCSVAVLIKAKAEKNWLDK